MQRLPIPRDPSEQADIAIVGGGLVGASLAVALAPLGLRLVLVESQPLPASAAPSWDERCIAINAASQGIFDGLGLWEAIAPGAEPITSTHISERGRFGVARFSAAEAGLPALGYNAPLRVLGAALAARLPQLRELTVLAPARLLGLRLEAEAAVLRLQSGAGESQCRARLLVAADGARSTVRELLGIAAQSRDYAQSAIVTAVRPQRHHRGVAYERFLPSGPLALLPKPMDESGPACSLVWTVPGARCAELMALPDEQFLPLAQESFGERLGRFLALGRRGAYPLQRVMSATVSAPRVLLLGNAAQSLHPVAAQGFNLGLRDVATLVQVLADAGRGCDPGAAALLARYGQQRARDRARVADFTDGLVRLFSNAVPGLRGLRHLGLLMLELTPPLKQAVMQQNLGYGAGLAPHPLRRG